MAAITAGVVGAGAALYGANRQSSAAKDAARAQASGVEAARGDTEAATNRARAALTGGYYPELYQPFYQQEQPTMLGAPQQQQLAGPAFAGARPMGTPQMGPAAIQQEDQGVQLRIPSSMGGRFAPAIRAARASNQSSSQGIVGQLAGQLQPAQQTASSMQQIPGFTPPQINDPRADFLQGVGSNLQFTNQGYEQAQGTLSPLAQMAQPYLNEQSNLLGMGGDEAYQQALSRVSDPMRAEQERAIMRNNAALGGVGGNVLAQLAEATRARTEANIGNRLGQLSAASSPSLGALQNISNMQLNRNLRMGETMQGAGAGLSDMETNRRQALANLELGQVSQMAQLSQNLGNARAGGSAYAAGNAPALSQGIMSGLSAYMGAGGTFGGGDPFGSRAAGYSFTGDPFA